MGQHSFKQVAALFLTWLASSRGAIAYGENAPQVNSTSGTIIGHRAPQRPETFEFLGIKYGQAPVGELRFAAPERYSAPLYSVYNASDWVKTTSPSILSNAD